jgi:hypothetical protein
MKTPERSAALARVLTMDTDYLPKGFAAQVAALANADTGAWRFSGNDVGLLGAFAAMIGLCVSGWLWFAAPEPGAAEWLGPIVGAMASYPWLTIGVTAIAAVQMLTLHRRATI